MWNYRLEGQNSHKNQRGGGGRGWGGFGLLSSLENEGMTSRNES